MLLCAFKKKTGTLNTCEIDMLFFRGLALV